VWKPVFHAAPLHLLFQKQEIGLFLAAACVSAFASSDFNPFFAWLQVVASFGTFLLRYPTKIPG
jgi:hypothetical protein